MGIFCNPFAAFILIGIFALLRGIRLIKRREVTQHITRKGIFVTVRYTGRIPVLMGIRLVIIPIFIITGIILTFNMNSQLWNGIGFTIAIVCAIVIEMIIRRWQKTDEQHIQ